MKTLKEKRQKEMDKIIKWFLDEKDGALVCISDADEKHATAAKILSRLACLAEKLTDHIK